ncbi:hypothetical protein ACLMJK_004621 [Lecanora helva]
MPFDPAVEVISLDRILQIVSTSKDPANKWTWKQRMLLAYKLATSMLEFHSTPWLDGKWGKHAIFFLRDQGCISSDPSVLHASLKFEADRPFISCDVSTDPRSSSSTPSNPKACLLELGILLLEIWHVRPFESSATANHLTISETYGSRYEAARRWYEDTADNILPFYSDPVCRCIEGTFASSSPTLVWSDLQFSKSLCEYLVKPLWENCSNKRL